MDLIQLTADYELKPFDCGDADLNGFLMNDAKSFFGKKVGKNVPFGERRGDCGILLPVQ